MSVFNSTWNLRCPECGDTWDAWNTGMVRAGSLSWKKRTMVMCPKCRRLCRAALERQAAKPKRELESL